MYSVGIAVGLDTQYGEYLNKKLGSCCCIIVAAPLLAYMERARARREKIYKKQMTTKCRAHLLRYIIIIHPLCTLSESSKNKCPNYEMRKNNISPKNVIHNQQR